MMLADCPRSLTCALFRPARLPRQEKASSVLAETGRRLSRKHSSITGSLDDSTLSSIIVVYSDDESTSESDDKNSSSESDDDDDSTTSGIIITESYTDDAFTTTTTTTTGCDDDFVSSNTVISIHDADDDSVSTPFTSTETVPAFEHLGCFKDDRKDRVLSHKVTSDKMTTAVSSSKTKDRSALW